MSRLVLLSALATVSTLMAADVSGAWQGTIEQNGPVAVHLTFVQHGQEVSGTAAIGDRSRQLPVEKAELHGDTLAFELHDNANKVVKFRLSVGVGALNGELSVGDEVSKVTLSPVRNTNPIYTVEGGKNTPPVLIHKVEPDQTPTQGSVVLQVEIESDGSVDDKSIQVLRSLASDADRKAIECVKQWKFKPATKNGYPVAMTATIEVNFLQR